MESSSAAPASRGERIAVVAILLTSLALRLALLPHRWINPDEGAHLMDGRLLLDGLIPVVDFDSRQVLYVYVLAGWLRLTGFHLETARLLPLGVSVGVGLLVFAIARRLFGGRSAVFATAVYSFFPLSVLWSANVHMQPIALLLAGLAFFFLTGTLDRRPIRAAALAGVCFGLTFYVRESALAATAAAVLFILATASTWGDRVRRVGALAAGFLLVSAIMIGSYSLVLTPAQLWHGPLNPLSLPLRALTGSQLWLGPDESFRISEAAGGRFEQQTLWKALSNIRLMGALALFLLVGLGGSLRSMGRAAWQVPEKRREAAGFLLLWLWFGLVALAYTYWTLKLGFYPQYFTELVPPLAIAFGAVVPRAAERWAGRELPAWLWVAVALLLAGIFASGRVVELSTPVYLAAPPLLLAAGAALATGRRAQAWLGLGAMAAVVLLGIIPAMPAATAVKAAAAVGALAVTLMIVREVGRTAGFDFVMVALAAGTAAFSMQRAGRVLSPSYQCVWPRELLAPVAALIRERSAPNEQVMSGAVVWEFEAGRRPFLLISHPLKFAPRRTAAERAEVEHGLATAPPRIVVLDGYTERSYGKTARTLTEVVERRYELLATLPGGRYPVRLYRRTD